MKRAGILLALLATMLMSASVFAEGSDMKKADQMNKMDKTGKMDKMGQMDEGKMEGKTMTVKGEIVDMGCYLGHGARGADHKSCAEMCIKSGMPMGLLTDNGTLYLLTLSHDNADPFNKAKGMAAETVSITGPMHEKNGMKSIEVTAVTEAAGMKSGSNN